MPLYYHVPHYCGVYYLPHTVNIVNVHTAPAPSWLPQVSLATDSKLYDSSSRTILTQTFINPSKRDVIEDAKYNFPLYESCAVVAFRCFVQGRLIEGVVKEKEEARAVYDKAVSQGETAGLLEQFSPDVFRTSLGNIPAGATVKVEVEYIMELKHDAEVDGLRFTIPTSIAPRYGNAPTGLRLRPGHDMQEEGGMKISVQITMPSNIRSVQSPSHPITMHLGGHVEDVADEAFNPKHALATLSQTSTELGSDFVLLVKCVDLSSPRALLETHLTKPNSRALMVTLVPKFTLPSGPRPEIVFVVDRSGSMSDKVTPLKSSLSVFLKSLPVGIRFNICSFGSSHSFLWETSQPYSADTLEEAKRHVRYMSANMGGTEILLPIQEVIARRLKDLPLEIMVLTDGEVWNTGPLFEFIEKETAKGDVRVFTLGIGRDVSHSLVEGMARVGRGFAQILSDEKEGMEGKVVRMLRGGLSTHINDYRMEWDGRPTEEQVQRTATSRPITRSQSKRKINLFDVNADTDTPINSEKTRAERFSHLPKSSVPTVLQTPYKLPPLFPFSRYTVFVIFTGDLPPPSSVWLKGTTSSGDELELEIPVQVLPTKAQTIHQLAARKLLQELEEGTSYLHGGNYGINKEQSPGTFGDWVEREGIRVGVEYGLASKWTSFVAVKKTRKEGTAARLDDPDFHDLVLIDSDFTTDDEDLHSGNSEKAGKSGDGSLILERYRERDRRDSKATGGKAREKQTARKSTGKSDVSLLPISQVTQMPSMQMQMQMQMVSPPVGYAERSLKKRNRVVGATNSPTGLAVGRGRRGTIRHRMVLADAVDRFMDIECDVDEADEDELAASDLNTEQAVKTARKLHALAQKLISLQSFDGSFSLTQAFASVIGVTLVGLQAKLMEFIHESGPRDEEKDKLWATILAVTMFERKLPDEKDMWELVVIKARDWISGVDAARSGDVESLEKLAVEVLGD